MVKVEKGEGQEEMLVSILNPIYEAWELETHTVQGASSVAGMAELMVSGGRPWEGV